MWAETRLQQWGPGLPRRHNGSEGLAVVEYQGSTKDTMI